MGFCLWTAKNSCKSYMTKYDHIELKISLSFAAVIEMFKVSLTTGITIEALGK